LGILKLITPGWMDGGLKDVPDEKGIALVTRWVRELRPEVLISFGPEGGASGHADHRAAWRWTDAAFDRAADPEYRDGWPPDAPAKFYWIAWPETVPDLRGIPSSPASAILEVGEEIDRLKRKAFAEHATQQDHLTLFNRFQDALQGREFFHLAKSRIEISSGLETDLMADIPVVAGGLPEEENSGYSTPKERECS
jgi:LmbE family N-acetylglucosaminyl deacetylase